MIKIGIIKEYKIPNDFRTPFTPSQADEINKLKEYLIVCQSSDIRCFDDKEYNDRSVNVVNNLNDCDIIFGIKEVPKEKLIPNKTYFMFSHTIKKHEPVLLVDSNNPISVPEGLFKSPNNWVIKYYVRGKRNVSFFIFINYCI